MAFIAAFTESDDSKFSVIQKTFNEQKGSCDNDRMPTDIFKTVATNCR